MKEINRERFEAWLFSQPREIIIESSNGNRCFLCLFIKETTNQIPYMSGWRHWYPSEVAQQRSERLELPNWVTRLIDREWIMPKSDNTGLITVGQMQDRYRLLFPDFDTGLSLSDSGTENPASTVVLQTEKQT